MLTLLRRKGMNKIYHLQVECYPGRQRPSGSVWSEIFHTHNEALKSGEAYLRSRIQKMYRQSDYYDSQAEEECKIDFIKDGSLNIRFLIYEVDLDILDNYKAPGNKEHHKNKPPHIEYEYHYCYCEGEGWKSYLAQQNWAYSYDNYQSFGSYLNRRDGDDLPGVGKKFAMGDFVKLKRPFVYISDDNRFSDDQVFVIVGTPCFDEDGLLKENTYKIDTIGKYGNYVWDIDFHYPFQGIHEEEIEMAESDDIPKENYEAFIFLQCLFRNQLGNEETTSRIVRKLENHEIHLTSKLSWRDIPELKELVKE